MDIYDESGFVVGKLVEAHPIECERRSPLPVVRVGEHEAMFNLIHGPVCMP